MADVVESATPEMIAAAWETWHDRHGGKLGPGPAFVEAINVALRARLSQAGAGGVVVRALEWREALPGRWRASVAFGGLYDIYEASDGNGFRIQFSWSQALWDLDRPTLDDAKAAAQSDYEARIRSALASSPRAGEPVAWRYRYNGQWLVCDNEAFARQGFDVTPLYATPPATPVQPTASASVEADKLARIALEKVVRIHSVDDARRVAAEALNALASLTPAPTQGDGAHVKPTS